MNIQPLTQTTPSLTGAAPGQGLNPEAAAEMPIDWSWAHRAPRPRQDDLPPGGWDRRRSQPALRRRWLFPA